MQIIKTLLHIYNHLRSQLNFHTFFKVTYTMDGYYRQQRRQQPNEQHFQPDKRDLKRVWA
ncbi:hypothetical protein [Nostoc sp.]|uniref:hypothetical protein n=1 Tax=Nostoc sp. TaxID=1180 RepID=UPI002FFC2A18